MELMYEFKKPESLLSSLADIWQEACFADLDVVVGGQHFAAHRAILAKRSAFFHKLLQNCSQDERKTELCLLVPLKPFKLLLAYLYTGKLAVNSGSPMADVLQLLKLATLFELSEVVEDMIRSLPGNLNIDNVVDTLKWSFVNRDYPIITKACFGFMDRHVVSLLKHSTFNSMSSHELSLLLERNTFGASEEVIFQCVLAWHKANPNADLLPVLRNIRFALFDLSFLAKVVHAADIIALPLLYEIMEQQIANSVQPRVMCLQGKEVIFDLGKLTTINSISFQLIDVENTGGIPFCVYSSLDREKWTLVQDRSWATFKDKQNIKLLEMETHFIKISTLSGKCFRVESLLAEKTNYQDFNLTDKNIFNDYIRAFKANFNDSQIVRQNKISSGRSFGG